MAGEQSTYSITGRFTGQDKIIAGFLGIKDASDKATNRIIANNQKASNSWNQHTKSMGGFVSNLHKMDRFLSGYQMISVGSIFRGQIESFKPFIDEALKLSQAQAKFRAINLSEGDNQRGFTAVAETVKNLKGMRLNEVTETLTDLHTATGSLTHALEGLEVASKFRFGFQTMLGDKFSPEQIESMIQKGFKAMELMGVMQLGQKAINERFNAMAKMMTATGGRVTPDMILLMAQRGGTSLRSLSTEGMMRMAAPIQELGGSRAGTALMSLYQQLVGGVGGGRSATEEFMRLGLVDPKKVKMSARGLPTHTEPGAFGAFGAALQDDPLKAADILVKAMAHPKKGKPIQNAQLLVDALATGATLSAEQLQPIRLALANLFHNRMAQNFMDIFVTQRAQVMKEFDLANAAKNIQQLYDQALSTPAGKIKEFEAAIANLEATVGGPLLSAFTEALDRIRPFIEMMGRHPEITLFTLAGFKLIGMLGQLAIAARMSGLTSLFGTGAGAVAGAGGAAGVGAAEGAAGAGAGSALAGGAGAGLARAAGLMKGAGVVTAIILILNKVVENYLDNFKAAATAQSVEKLKEARDKIIEEQYASLRKSGKGILGASDKTADLDAAIGKKLAENPKAFKPNFLDMMKERFSGHSPGLALSDDSVTRLMEKDLRGVGLQNAGQARAFITALKEKGELTQEALAIIEQLAHKLFPDLGTEAQGLAAGATAAIEGIKLLKMELLGIHPPSYPGLAGESPGSRHSGGDANSPKNRFFDPSFFHATGGIATRATLGIFGERGPEAILPLDKLPALMQRASAGIGALEVHVHQSISGGEITETMLARIEHVTKAAVRASSHEIRKALDDRTRDRELMI